MSRKRPGSMGGAALRKKAYEQWGPHCWWCGVVLTYEESTLEHIVPVNLGGRKRCWRNVVVACNDCNNMKADAHPLVFLAALFTEEDPRPWLRARKGRLQSVRVNAAKAWLGPNRFKHGGHGADARSEW